ncbi:MAG: protein kinase [Eubacteriales bacterium]|nr:protein kinase [Eubacteriales bacterium]
MDRDLPVSVWPEWKIIEKIGEGSFGKVYKAQRLERDKAFYSAVKIISIPSNQGELKSVRSEMGSDQRVREYFQNLVEECIQEVSTMEYFRGNSHVVAVEDYKVVEYLDTVGWDIYIRMEYLTSFLEYCAGKQMDESEVIQLGIDLCKALEYCQKLNIIHRDIKPENIFVSRFGEFKLGDFGIARELERTMSTLSKKGTYSYMAPEMYKGEQYDSRVDIYSLGIMLYKLRNRNRLPFLSLEKQLITYRDKENALTRRMSGEPLQAPADSGEGLAQVILKACAYNRDERYRDAAEFRQALEDLKYNRKMNVQPQKRPKTDNPAHSMKRPQRETSSQSQKRLQADSSPQPVRQRQLAEHQQSVRQAAGSQPIRQSQQGGKQSGQRQTQPVRQVRPVQTQTVPEEQREEPVRRENVSELQRQSASSKRRKKKEESGTKGLVAAVIVMSIAVVIVTAVFFRLLFEDNENGIDTNEPTGIASVLEEGGMDESEKEGLAEALSVIRDHATTIVNDLDTYNWIGTEKQGKIGYLDTVGKVKKVLIFPNLSEDGVYEEYYYWDDELFFAYIWEDSSTDSDLADGEITANYYYYKNGKLIRWIDERNICHDYETDNDEYNTRGERYLKRSAEYIMEYTGNTAGTENNE